MDKPRKNRRVPAGFTLRHVRRKRTPKGEEREVRFERKGPRIRRVRKVGDVEAVRRKLWQAVLAAEDLLLDPKASRDDQTRAVHALVQAGGAYRGILEVADLEARIRALEEAAKNQPGQMRRAV